MLPSTTAFLGQVVRLANILIAGIPWPGYGFWSGAKNSSASPEARSVRVLSASSSIFRLCLVGWEEK